MVNDRDLVLVKLPTGQVGLKVAHKSLVKSGLELWRIQLAAHAEDESSITAIFGKGYLNESEKG